MNVNSSSQLPKSRIARISTVPFFIITQLQRQLQYLVENGAEVLVITSEGLELEALKKLLGIKIVCISIVRKINVVKDIAALIQLIWIFKKEKIQIVHSTTPKAGLLTAIAAFVVGVPIRLHTFTGQQWLYLRGPVRWISRYADWVVGLLNTQCYADSHSQRAFLIDQKVITAQKLKVLGKGSLAGVDTTRFSMARFPDEAKAKFKRDLVIPEKAPVVLFVGRVAIDKGIRELIAAFRLLGKKIADVHLLIVGPCDDADKPFFAGFEQELNVHWIGHSSAPESYMAIADILCLPSYREGFGTVVLEAAAMGLPTVGSAIYGLSDAIVHNETGLLVPPKDTLALAEALKSLLDQPERMKQMGEVARVRAVQHFDALHVNGLLIQEYQRLLSERGLVV